jgi:hypothetical protein
LADNLTPNASVRATFDFHEGGNSALVDKDVIHGPTDGTTFLVGDSGLSCHEQPRERRTAADLIPGQHAWALCQQLLKQPFGVVGLILHFNDLVFVVNEEDGWNWHVRLSESP